MTVADRVSAIGYTFSPSSRAAQSPGRTSPYTGRHRGFGTAQRSRIRMRYVARHAEGRITPLTFAAALFR
jgi:hypothetical protein